MSQNRIQRYCKSVIEHLKGHPSLQNIINNISWLLLDNLMRILFGFFVNAWIIRYLGPERFGTLSYAIAFVTIFAPVAQLGLDGIVVRNLVTSPEKKYEILGSAFVLKLVGAVLTIIIALITIFALRPEDSLIRGLVAISLFGTLFQAFNVIEFWFQAQLKSKYAVIAKCGTSLLIYSIKILLIIFSMSLVAFAWAGLLELVVVSGGLLTAYKIADQRMQEWRPTKIMALQLLNDSMFLMFADLIYYLYLRIDKIMIGEISGTAELGVYSVAVTVAEAFFFIAQSVSLSVFPMVIEAKSANKDLFKERMQKYYNLMVFIGYMVAVPISLAAGWLTPLIFGEQYERSVPMLIVLVWSGVFINLINARSYYLTAMNWTRLHLVIDVIGFLINVALNVYLIPLYGGLGAAIASVATYSFSAYILCFTFKTMRESGVMMTRALLYPKFW